MRYLSQLQINERITVGISPRDGNYMTEARLNSRGCAQDASMPNRPRFLRSSERLRDAGDKSNATATPREGGGG